MYVVLIVLVLCKFHQRVWDMDDEIVWQLLSCIPQSNVHFIKHWKQNVKKYIPYCVLADFSYLIINVCWRNHTVCGCFPHFELAVVANFCMTVKPLESIPTPIHINFLWMAITMTLRLVRLMAFMCAVHKSELHSLSIHILKLSALLINLITILCI